MTHTASTPFFALTGQMVARAWRVFKNRRQFTELKDWSDEQLNDIGLTRSDVRRALAQPFYSDPTSSLLSSVTMQRRQIRRQAANTERTFPALTLVSPQEDKRGQLAA